MGFIYTHLIVIFLTVGLESVKFYKFYFIKLHYFLIVINVQNERVKTVKCKSIY